MGKDRTQLSIIAHEQHFLAVNDSFENERNIFSVSRKVQLLVRLPAKEKNVIIFLSVYITIAISMIIVSYFLNIRDFT